MNNGSVNEIRLPELDPEHAQERLTGIWARMTRAKVFPGGPLAQAALESERASAEVPVLYLPSHRGA